MKARCGRAQRTVMSSEEKGFLVVGLACLDIVVVCSSFPEEDTDTRTSDYYWQRGGNAANSCSVLSRLGANAEFFGAIASDSESMFLREDLKKYGIPHDQCPVYSGDKRSPTSVIIINGSNGSRTILHTAKNLPEVKHEDFQKIDISKYKWIHFEGRPTAEDLSGMINHIKEHNTNVDKANEITISLELEKEDRPQLEPLMSLVDYVFISKEMSMSLGYFTKEDAVAALIKKCKHGGYLICPWGDQGAVAMSSDGTVYSSPVFSPDKVVDTLGAGDTFLAAAIFSLSQGNSIQNSIYFACKVAGTKCGMKGYMGLSQFAV